MSSRSDADPGPAVAADATMAFVQAFDAWMRRASVANSGEGVTRLRLLNELHCNGPRKMADLAESRGVTPRNVTALVDALEREALVRRAAHPTDRRVTLVEITGGSTTVAAQFEAFRTAMTHLFDDLSPAERAVVVSVLSRIS
jgi:DNA-binding MarR family transcriptional regulator